MGPYALSGRDSTKGINRFLQRIGEKPVVFDSVEAERTRMSMEIAVRNMGYLQAHTSKNTVVKGKKLKVVYTVKAGDLYTIRNFDYTIEYIGCVNSMSKTQSIASCTVGFLLI